MLDIKNTTDRDLGGGHIRCPGATSQGRTREKVASPTRQRGNGVSAEGEKLIRGSNEAKQELEALHRQLREEKHLRMQVEAEGHHLAT